jgi:hypothetical protein
MRALLKPLAKFIFLNSVLVVILACGQAYSMSPAMTNTPLNSNGLHLTAVGTESVFARADQYYREMIRGTMVFTPPRSMQLKKPVTVMVTLNPGQAAPTVALQTPDGPQVITSEIQMAPYMSADLDAMEEGTFDIQSHHRDRVQMINSLQKTQWSWTVTPLKPGSHSLLLKLSYVLSENGPENLLDSYPANVEVIASPVQRLQLNWGWLAAFLGTILLIIALWIGLHRLNQIDRQQPAEQEQASIRRSKGTGITVANGGNIFISYRRSDSADITGRIYDRLISEFDEACVFKDVDSIPLGADFKKYLDVKVSECKALLAIIGSTWVACRDEADRKRLDDPDDFVRVEIESALKRDIPVIPLLVQGAQMPEEMDLPPALQKLVYQNGMPIRPDPDFHNDMDRLISALERYLQ